MNGNTVHLVEPGRYEAGTEVVTIADAPWGDGVVAQGTSGHVVAWDGEHGGYTVDFVDFVAKGIPPGVLKEVSADAI